MKLNPTVLLLCSLFIFWGCGYETVYTFLAIQVQGTIVASRRLPYSPAPSRYATEYVLRSPEGEEVHYVAGPTAASLPRDMPVGTSIRKLRWHLSYERSGQAVTYGFWYYAVILAIATASLYWSLHLWRMRRLDTGL